MTDYFTLKELAEQVGVNYSTARGYVERFSPYFPTHQLQGVRWPVYEPQARDVLQLIKQGYDDGHAVPQILDALRDRYGEVIDLQRPQSALSVSEPITASLLQMAQQLQTGKAGVEHASATIELYEHIIKAKNDQIAWLLSELERLETENEQLRKG